MSGTIRSTQYQIVVLVLVPSSSICVLVRLQVAIPRTSTSITGVQGVLKSGAGEVEACKVGSRLGGLMQTTEVQEGLYVVLLQVLAVGQSCEKPVNT